MRSGGKPGDLNISLSDDLRVASGGKAKRGKGRKKKKRKRERKERGTEKIRICANMHSLFPL